MANDVRVNINVTDNGSTEKVNATALKLKKTLEGAQAAARVPMATQAAKAGVANAAYAPGASDTNLSRGIGGQTGASGRDFAAQAQGLGGLVHVYATFAANLFAVSAAFTALSKAADFSNMVKGLDQIGAASGRSLSTLAKQLVNVTDGAISLREAMTATALATSGGMTNSAILRMGIVAKQASLALGRDLPDSMERLSKGIVKTQPELLDELGIMTKVIPAQQAYALSLNKSMASLTDFEKKQAFANSVLAEGERKFGAIQLEANSFSKILSSMGNLALAGLEVVNKAISPVVNILASSPTALAIAIGTFATVLLKQAIPALGQFKENAKIAADSIRNTALLRASEARKGYASSLHDAKIAAEQRAELEVEAVLNAEAKIKTLRNSARKGSASYNILAKDLHEVTSEDIARLELNAKQQEAKGNLVSAAAHREYATSLKGHMIAEEAYSKKVIEVAKQSLDNESALTTSKQTQIIANRALLASSSQNIISQAAQTASTKGFTAAVKEAYSAVQVAKKSTNFVELTNSMGEVEKLTVPAMKSIQSGWTLVRSGISAATGALGTLINAASIWITVAEVVIGGLVALAAWMSTNSEAYDKFSGTIEAGSGAMKLSNDVLANSIKEVSVALTSQMVLAKAGALDTLTAAIENQASAYRKVLEDSSKWDKVTEGFWHFFGKGAGDKVAKSISDELSKSFEIITSGTVKKELQNKLVDILQLPATSGLKEISSAIKKLPDAADKGVSKFKQLSEAIKAASDNVVKMSATLNDLKTALEIMARLSSEFNTSLLPKTEQYKFGDSIITAAFAMGKALQDPINAVIALNEITKDADKLNLFSKSDQQMLLAYSDELKAIGIQDKINIDSTDEYTRKLEQLSKVQSSRFETTKGGAAVGRATTRGGKIQDSSNEILELKRLQEHGLVATAELEVKRQQILEATGSIVLNAYKKGAELTQTAITEAYTKAAVIIGQAQLAGISGRGLSAESDKLKQLEISGQRTVVDAMYANTIATIGLTNQMELKALYEKDTTKMSEKEKATLSATIKEAEATQKLIQDLFGGKMSSPQLGKLIEQAQADKKFGMAATLNAARAAVSGKEIKTTELNAQSEVSKITLRKGILAENTAAQTQLNILEIAYNKSLLEEINMQTQSSSLYDKELEVTATKIERDNILLENSNKMLAIQSAIRDMEDSGKTKTQAYKDKLNELNTLSGIQTKELSIYDTKKKESHEVEVLTKTYKDIADQRESDLAKQEDSLSIESANLDLKNSLLFLSIAQTAEETKLAAIKVAEHKRDVAYYNTAIKYAQESDKIQASSASDEVKKKKQDDLMTSYSLAIGIIKNGFDKDVTIAGIESAKTIGAEWKSTAESITSGLTDSFITSIDSAESLFVNLRNSVTSMFKNMVLRPTIQGALNSMVGGTVGAAGSAATGGLIGGLTGSSLSLIGTEIGTAASVSMSNGLISGFSANMSSIAATVEGGSWAAAFGLAVPYVAAAAAIYSILSQDHGTPTQSTGNARIGYNASGSQTSYETFFGGSNKDTDKAVANLQAAYMAGAKSLGIATVAASFGYGGNTGKDSANPNFAITSGAGSQWYSSGETALTDEAVKLASSRAVFAALQGSELPKYLVGVFDGIVASTATQDQITAVLDTAQAFKTLHDQLLNLPFKNLKDLSYEATKGLVEAAGGLDKLSSSLETYYTNFYSAEEQRAQTISNINRSLAGSGFDAATATKEQFRSLVESQDVTTASGQALYTTLLSVSGAFSSLFDTTTKLTTAEELRKAQLDQEIKIYQLLGEESKALALSRGEELRLLDERLHPSQEYIYALEDEATLKDKLKSAYDKVSSAIKTTISSLQANVKTLKDYKNALSQGNSSTLTPYQKYLQAKQSAYDTSVTASSTGMSAAEVVARNEAISKLPTVAGSFLDASRALYASSAQYTSDYNMVSSYIDSLATIQETQLTDAQKQLADLDASTSFLQSIDITLTDTYSLLGQYLSAVQSTESYRQASAASGSIASLIVPGHAGGGLARGISVVGEYGPELVDFKNPGRVYSNRASNDLLNNKELVQEIKNLRQELNQLRQEQREQTGHLITANYDANLKAANKVVDATETAASDASWNERTRLKVA